MALDPQQLGPWFFSVNRTTAEEQLAAMGADSFLVRPSSVPSCFALSKYIHGAQAHQHFLISINPTDGTVRLQDSQIDQHVYPTLPELVSKSMELAGFAFPQGSATHVQAVRPDAAAQRRPGTRVATLRRGRSQRNGSASGFQQQQQWQQKQSVTDPAMFFAPGAAPPPQQQQPQPHATAVASAAAAGRGAFQPKRGGSPKSGFGRAQPKRGGAAPGFLGAQRTDSGAGGFQSRAQAAQALQDLQQQERIELQACIARHKKERFEMLDAMMELELDECRKKWSTAKLQMTETIEYKKR